MTILFSLLVLAAATLLPSVMILFRWLATGSPGFLFLWWNLFLAWLPLLFALLAVHWRARSGWRLLAGIGWLLFLPNAPYLITDLIHFRFTGPLLVWYDLILLMMAASVGLLLGFASVKMVQELVAGYLGQVAGWLFALSSLALCAVGIYLGRFLRWNSWDLLAQPDRLFADIAHIVTNPVEQLMVYGFVLLFSLMLILLYTGGQAGLWLAGQAAQARTAASSREKILLPIESERPLMSRENLEWLSDRARSSIGKGGRQADRRSAA